jgi:ribosomal protein S27E
MNITEKVAYLRGLAEGLSIGDETKEGKLFRVVIDVLEDIALELEDMSENELDLGEEIDQISDDLALLEEEVYGECCCDDEDEDDEDEDEAVFYTVRCDACGNVITIDEDVLALGTLSCPGCGEPIELCDETVAELVGDEDDD